MLVPVVLGIWGYIGWKIYDGMQGDDAAALPALAAPAAGGTRMVPDTFQLVANYRDPFLGKVEAPRTNISNSNAPKAPQLPKPPAPTASWPSITYGGMIKKKEGPPFALLTVAGSDYLVKAGEKAGDVQVISISRDSIFVAWGKEKRGVRK